jgi:hypothetical protein
MTIAITHFLHFSQIDLLLKDETPNFAQPKLEYGNN